MFTYQDLETLLTEIEVDEAQKADLLNRFDANNVEYVSEVEAFVEKQAALLEADLLDTEEELEANAVEVAEMLKNKPQS